MDSQLWFCSYLLVTTLEPDSFTFIFPNLPLWNNVALFGLARDLWLLHRLRTIWSRVVWSFFIEICFTEEFHSSGRGGGMRNREGTFRYSILQGNCASTLASCFLKVKAEIWIKQLKANSDQCLKIMCDLFDRLSVYSLEKTYYFMYCDSSCPWPIYLFIYCLFTVIAPIHFYIILQFSWDLVY